MQIFQKIKITLQGCSNTNRNISLHSIAQILDFSSVRNLKFWSLPAAIPFSTSVEAIRNVFLLVLLVFTIIEVITNC